MRNVDYVLHVHNLHQKDVSTQFDKLDYVQIFSRFFFFNFFLTAPWKAPTKAFWDQVFFKIFFQDFLFFDFFLNLFVLLSSLRPSTRSLLPLCFFPSLSSFPSSFPSFSSSGQFLSLAPGLPPGPPTPPHCVGRATLEFNGPLPQGEWRGPVCREGSTTHRERERE